MVAPNAVCGSDGEEWRDGRWWWWPLTQYVGVTARNGGMDGGGGHTNQVAARGRWEDAEGESAPAQIEAEKTPMP